MGDSLREESILIGTTRHMDALHDRLYAELKPLENHGLRVNLEKKLNNQINFVTCNFITSNSVKRRMRNFYLDNVANAICEIILNHWEKMILENIIKETYYYFNADERKSILINAIEHISGDGFENQSFYRKRRKKKIMSELSKFLSGNDYIVIDGFIRFRLKDYVNELCEVAEQAVDNFLMEKEYHEFVQLLKYFVDVQDSKVNKVNVLMNYNGGFELYDENGTPVDNQGMEEFMIEFISNEVNYEDLLVSSLVTIAPREIVFHFKPSQKQKIVFDTIQEVFSGKVKYCPGCAMCQKHKND